VAKTQLADFAEGTLAEQRAKSSTKRDKKRNGLNGWQKNLSNHIISRG